MIDSDESIKAEAQSWARDRNITKKMKTHKFFKHYKDGLKKCHDGIKSVGGILITFGRCNGKNVLIATGESSKTVLKLFKKFKIDLNSIFNNVDMFDRLKDISNLSASKAKVTPINETVKMRRKTIKHNLLRKYQRVFPDAKSITWELLSQNSFIIWPEGVD